MAILTYLSKKNELLYALLKIWVRLASLIFCRKIVISDPSRLKMEGPLLLACNHPNSFLDAVILDILFERPIWSLTRGDVFKKPWHRKLLMRLKMLPVYRVSEGVENLETNYSTFNQCKSIFRDNGLVLMFSEGQCINEWHLRPLKKGTARLAFSSWDDGIPLRVLPVGINYSSFRRFGKNLFIHFGSEITRDHVYEETEGKKFNAFNELLRMELEKGVYEIQPDDQQAAQRLEVRVSTVMKILLFLPAAAGFIIHAPLYIPLKRLVVEKLREPEHYDGVLTGLIVLSYPFYVILLILLGFGITGSWWTLSLFVILPGLAWAYVRIKRQLDN